MKTRTWLAILLCIGLVIAGAICFHWWRAAHRINRATLVVTPSGEAHIFWTEDRRHDDGHGDVVLYARVLADGTLVRANRGLAESSCIVGETGWLAPGGDVSYLWLAAAPGFQRPFTVWGLRLASDGHLLQPAIPLGPHRSLPRERICRFTGIDPGPIGTFDLLSNPWLDPFPGQDPVPPPSPPPQGWAWPRHQIDLPGGDRLFIEGTRGPGGLAVSARQVDSAGRPRPEIEIMTVVESRWLAVVAGLLGLQSGATRPILASSQVALDGTGRLHVLLLIIDGSGRRSLQHARIDLRTGTVLFTTQIA